MEIVIEYNGVKKFSSYLLSLTKKYKTVTKVTIVFRKKVNTSLRMTLQRMGISDYRFVTYKLPLLLYKLHNISKNNLDLALVLTDKTSKTTLKRAKKLNSITAVYDLSDDKTAYETLKDNKNLIFDGAGDCTVNHLDALTSIYFNRPTYGCHFSSCLGNKLYVDLSGNVSFCPSFAQQTRVGKVDDEADYFSSPLFIEVLTKEIEKRNECKAKCSLAMYCKGGCAMLSECEQIKETFSYAKAINASVTGQNADLSQLNLALKRAVLEYSFSKKAE